MSDSILVDVDLEPAAASSSTKQKVDLQNCDNSREGKYFYCRINSQNQSIRERRSLSGARERRS